LRAVPRHGLGYGILRYGPSGGAAPRLAALPQAEVSFNYLGRLDPAVGGGALPFRFARESSGPSSGRGGVRSHLLEVNALVAGGRLRFDWAYGSEIHRQTTVERLAGGVAESLRRSIAASQEGALGLAEGREFGWSERQVEGISAALQKGRPRRPRVGKG
jgi:non-ribosomal peptide synthase protein (TIGR01720 family)